MDDSEIRNNEEYYDFLIIGAGLGGSAAAYGLRKSGASILILERGEFIPREKENWSVTAVAEERRYSSKEQWEDKEGKLFTPRMHYNVGGNSKFFGGSCFRFREKDFAAWPVAYDELAPWYDEAEKAMGVRGLAGADPCEPPRPPYPLPPVESEHVIEDLSRRLESQGLHPFPLPIAVDRGKGGRCRSGSPCDGFPCLARAKGDGEIRFLRPLLDEPGLLENGTRLTLLTGAQALKLEQEPDGDRIGCAVYRKGGKEYRQRAGRFILSAGAVQSAALLLKSANERHPQGLSNSSGQVGRNYMAHKNTVLMAFHPLKKNPTLFQKTLSINDYYERGWGNIQLRGKVKAPMLRSKKSWFLRLFSRYIAERSIDLWLMSEDASLPGNRVELNDEGRIRLTLKEGEHRGHSQLIRAACRMMRRAGYPLIVKDERGIEAVQHQCGTLKMGKDKGHAVVDENCRSHDHPNLHIADASVFPSSAAVNPALTVAALSLRTGRALSGEFES